MSDVLTAAMIRQYSSKGVPNMVLGRRFVGIRFSYDNRQFKLHYGGMV